jgi:diguanylate cyclase (GGDEF)-like protein/PAS domain S-box-containing protein
VFRTVDPAAALDRNLAGVFRESLAGTLLGCNDACARILGYSDAEEFLAAGRFDLQNPSDHEMIVAALRDTRSLTNLEIPLRRKDGSRAWLLQNISLVDSPDGEVIEGVVVDITEQRLAAERFEYQSQHDPLTGLPNRGLFIDRLAVALARARRRRSNVAVFFIDLDDFDTVNATFGRDAGDQLMKEVAMRFSDALRVEDNLARFNGDEFTVALEDFGEDENVAIIAQRLLDSLKRPLSIEGRDVFLNSSIGVSIFPADGPDGEALIKNAITAMTRAKSTGKNAYHLHQPALNARAFERMFLIENLRRALERGELTLQYEPEINVVSGRIECVQALLRWRHPDLGLIEPSDFLAAAEEGQLTHEINEWALRTAILQMKRWEREGLSNFRLSVGVPVRLFRLPEMLKSVDQALSQSAIDPGRLELSVAESIMQEPERALFALTELRDKGVKLALDSFGTGRSSFSDLRRTPIDTVKIDQSFIRNVHRRADDAALVEAMITVAHGLDLHVVAQGVETQDQLRHLRDHQLFDMQGFFFGRPLPPREIEQMLQMQH